MLFAQINLGDLAPFALWLGGASIAIFLLNQIITFWKEHVREKPIPSETYVTKEEHADVKKRLDGLAAAGAESRQKIYEKLNTQGEQIAGLKVETTSQTRMLHAFDAKIDRLLERRSQK